MNTIAQIKTVPAPGPNGPTHAMMISVNIVDPITAEDFVAHVAAQFNVHRMAAPPDTSMLLVTIMGDMHAGRFAAKWREAELADSALNAFMSLMVVADVIQGTRSGQQLSKASLLRA